MSDICVHFFHDGKRLVITAPYEENTVGINGAKNGSLESGTDNLSSIKNGGHKAELDNAQCASPTSSTCSIAGSVNSNFGSTQQTK